MNKKDLKELCRNGETTRSIAAFFGVSQVTVRYWLKKYNLKTLRGPRGRIPKDLTVPHKCACGETRPELFYGHKTSVCAKCHREYTTQRARNTKKWIVETMGGKCVVCGYCKNIAVLDVHHIDPEKKDLSFIRARGWGKSRLLREIKKCILLCSNCHRELHNPLHE